MRHLLDKLLGNLSASLDRSLLDIACLHEMGMLPVQADTFVEATQPWAAGARQWAGLAQLKHDDWVYGE